MFEMLEKQRLDWVKKQEAERAAWISQQEEERVLWAKKQARRRRTEFLVYSLSAILWALWLTVISIMWLATIPR